MRPALADVLARWEELKAHPRARRGRAWLRLHGKALLAVFLTTGIAAMVIHWS